MAPFWIKIPWYKPSASDLEYCLQSLGIAEKAAYLYGNPAAAELADKAKNVIEFIYDRDWYYNAVKKE